MQTVRSAVLGKYVLIMKNDALIKSVKWQEKTQIETLFAGKLKYISDYYHKL